MKLKYMLEVVDMGDELIAVPLGEDSKKMRGVIKINREGSEIIHLLSTDTTEERIVSYLAEKYENSKENIQLLVHGFIRQLHSMGLLTDEGVEI